MRKIGILLVLGLAVFLLTGCSPLEPAASDPASLLVLPSAIPTAPTTYSASTEPLSSSPTAASLGPDWKEWPVLPTVSDPMRAVYQAGLAADNDPHAFSILGDCQSLPEEFLGLYDTDPAAVAELPADLQQAVAHFAGSFDRYSPTVKDGTTTGALLWEQWNDNLEGGCLANETPLECELRVHRPSLVFIHIGTHWETRNYQYLTTIVEAILEHGAVPIVVTKADNRELDERVNQDLAALATEYGLPLWNFWAAVHALPHDGLEADSAWELSTAAQVIHRRSALEALDAVWRALQ